ncbi:uncharacterized protein LOC135811588 [Sycon ciliatum]|uniref:uncharacterized protein LOC135811588 n=1 Tax=Sycon ciliatum TaxID=27933 RepID=UPI0031F6F004
MDQVSADGDGSSSVPAAPVVGGGTTSQHYAEMKRKGSADQHSIRLVGQTVIDGVDSQHEFVSCSSEDERESVAAMISKSVKLNGAGSPRSAGSGESMELLSNTAALLTANGASTSTSEASDTLASMDTFELAQLYLRRTRRGTHSDSDAEKLRSVINSGIGGSDGFHSGDAGAGNSDGVHDLGELSLLRTLGDGAESSHDPLSQSAPASGLDLDDIRDQLRQRDQTLELAARVGQELLERNAALESDLRVQSTSRDQLQKETTQLQHEITVKEKLLKMYYEEMEDEDERAKALQQRRTSRQSSHSSVRSFCMSPARSMSSMSNISEEASQLLVAECEELRSANKLLAEEASLLHQQAALLDQREQELITECVRRLNEATQGLGEMQEAYRHREEVAEQHTEEIAALREMNNRIRDAYTDLSSEKVLLQSELKDMSTRQSTLSGQVVELQEQYVECLTLFRDAQSELALYRKHGNLPGHLATPTQAAIPRQQSIGSELNAAMRNQANEAPGSATPAFTPLVTTSLKVPSVSLSAAPLTPTTPTSLNSNSRSQGRITPQRLDSSRGAPTSGHVLPTAADLSTQEVLETAPSSAPHTPTGYRQVSVQDVTPLAVVPATPSFASPSAATSSYSSFTGGPLTPQGNGASPLLSSRSQHANQIMSAVRSLDSKQTLSRTAGVYQRNQATGTGGLGAALSTPTSHESPGTGHASAARTASTSSRQSLADQSPADTSTSSLAGAKKMNDGHERRMYTGPEKLRIVKPMEGSLTLLKWKLLALQQNTGADVLQKALSVPGIHQKGDESVGSNARPVGSGEHTPNTSESVPTILRQPAMHSSSAPLSAMSSDSPKLRIHMARGNTSPQPPRSSSHAAESSSSSSTMPVSSAAPVPHFAIGDSKAGADPMLAPPSTPVESGAAAATNSSPAGMPTKAATPPAGRITSRFSRFSGIGLGGALSGLGTTAAGFLGAASQPVAPTRSHHQTMNDTEIDGGEIE